MSTPYTDARITRLEAQRTELDAVLTQYNSGVAQLTAGAVVEYWIGDTRYRKSDIDRVQLAINGVVRQLDEIDGQLSMLYALKQNGARSYAARTRCP